MLIDRYYLPNSLPYAAPKTAREVCISFSLVLQMDKQRLSSGDFPKSRNQWVPEQGSNQRLSDPKPMLFPAPPRGLSHGLECPVFGADSSRSPRPA